MLPAVVLAIGLASASAASATTIILERGDMESGYREVKIEGFGGSVKAGPMMFDGYYSIPGPSNDVDFTDMVAFCVDVYHSISTGNYEPDLKYTDELDLTNDFATPTPHALNNDQVLQIGRLVNYGTKVFYNAPKTTMAQKNARWDELAAVQGAIWQVVSGKNVKHNGGVGVLDTRINNLSGVSYQTYFNASYGFIHRDITLLTPKPSYGYGAPRITQSFAVGVVPEPGAWALLIAGFGLTGAMLRRSRPRFAGAIA